MEECHKLLTDRVDDAIIRYNVIKPLPLGGQPGQVTIQTDFFSKDLEYLRYGSKGGRPALSISKIKAAYYPDVDLEQMVPDQIWIEEECKYDIAAMYGISHWWFQRQRFYIDRHTSEGDRKAVRTHMRILSVVRIEVFSLYGYDYMKKIVLHRADLKEHIIAEMDFKYLYPSDFEDLYLLNLQVGFNSLVHSFRALSTLRRSGLRTASAAAKPCQGDSSEFYLITGKTCEHAGPKVTTSHGSNTSQQRMLKRFTVADDLKECSKITQVKGTKPKSTTLCTKLSMNEESKTTSLKYVVPTGRVVVPTGRYVVPAGKVIIIVSPGRLSLVPTGRILSPGRDK
ncbi:hypothetical protein Tco_0716284 [Tanacetum coccineum]